MDLEYNSDEDPETRVTDEVDPYANLGQRLARKALDNVLEDRRDSKRFVNNLKGNFGVKSTNQEYARWWNRWTTFRSVTDTKTPLDLPPTMEMLERFLVTTTNNACKASISRRSSGIPSVGWLQRGLRAVIVGLRFRHSQWAPDKNAGTRFHVVIRELFVQNKLTRDPIKIKQWLTMRLTIQMANALMEQALTSDVKSWDVLIMRLLSWILQSAVDGRAGDVTMTKGYTTHFLKWEDFVFQLGEEGTFESLTVKVTLKNSKNIKEDPSLAGARLLEPLGNDELNVIDPLVLLLIHGFRTKVFLADNLDQVLELSKGQGVIEVRPECRKLPVICQIRNSGAQLVLDKPATTPQMNDSILMSADAFGMMAHFTTHDLKRGYTRDYTYAPSLKGAAAADVAFRINHTNKTLNNGVSQRYAGESRDAGFNHRVENPYDDKLQDKFGAKHASTAYKKRRLTSSEIDAEMLEGEDKKDTKARQRAQTRLHKRHREDFFNGTPLPAQAKRPALAKKSVNTSHVVKGGPRKTTSSKAKQKSVVPQDVDDDDGEDYDDEEEPVMSSSSLALRNKKASKAAPTSFVDTDDEFDDAETIQAMMDSLADSGVPQDYPADENNVLAISNPEDQEYHDPELIQVMMNSLSGEGIDQQEEETVEQLASALTGGGISDAVESMVEPETMITSKHLIQPATSFISMFSRIQAIGEGTREHREHPEGSGKMIWFIKCPNHDRGCSHEMIGYQKIRNHYLVCPYNASDYVKPPEIACDRDGCESTFKSEATMKKHIADTHDFESRQCSKKDDCGIETWFDTRKRLDSHTLKYHGTWIPTKCKFLGCNHSRVFDVYSSLKLYLKSAHALVTAQEQRPYMYPDEEE